jgi:amino acid adenylation domain-containing protein
MRITGQDHRCDSPKSGLSLPERFESVAARHRLRPAFGAGAWQPTYEELNDATNRVAHGLLDRGGFPGDRVAILMEHGAPAVAAMLAVLKAGRVMVGLNPTDPPARLRQILEDSEASLIVSDATHKNAAAELAPTIDAICIEDFRRGARIHNSKIPISHRDAAVLAYTSGSTGRPKAVVQTHGYFLDHVRRFSAPMQIVAEDRIVLLGSLAGSLGVGTALCSLLHGAALCPFPAMAKGVTGLTDWMISQRVTVYSSSSSLFRHFMRTIEQGVTFPDVRIVRLTSEQAEHEDFKAFCQHFADRCVFVHGFSSTEGGNIANLRLTRRDAVSEGRIPVGDVSEGIQVALVGEQDRPVDRGQTGEIVVKCRYLAAGYWRDDALTAAKFSDWTDEYGYQTLHTGDLGRFNSECQLEFIGRKDGRVKVRGYRIELSDVEEALRLLPDVANVAVCVFEQPERGPLLVAYVNLRSGCACTPATLRRRLGSVLPGYMIPSLFVMVDRFPLTPQAKIDRSALLISHPPLPARGRTGRAKTTTESRLCEIWEEAFNIAGIGPQDDFFELGGDSLIAAIIAAGVHAFTGVELNLEHFGDHPTIAQLARVIDETRNSAIGQTTPILVRIPRDGALPLSHIQERIWNFCRVPEVAAKYAVIKRHKIEGLLNVGTFHECLTYLFHRHETLRTYFPERNGRPTAVIRAPATAPLRFIDLSETSNAEEQAAKLLDQEAKKPVDVTQSPPLRFILVRLRSDLHWMMHVSHHIIADQQSWGIFVHELGLLYEAKRAGEKPPLSELEPLQYCDYAAWRRKVLSDRSLYQDTINWWKETFAERPQPPKLPFKRTRLRPDVAPPDGEISWRLDQDVSERLGALRRENGATHFIVRLAAFTAFLAAETGNPDVVVGGYVSRRNQLVLQRMLGDFADLVTFRYHLDPACNFRDWLSFVRRRFTETEAHCQVPYEQIRNELLHDGIRLPDPQIIFHRREEFLSARFGGLRLTPVVEKPRTMPWGLTLILMGHDDDDRYLTRFNAGIYDPAGVREMIDRYRRVLDVVSRAPDRPVCELLEMSEVEFSPAPTRWSNERA